nr:integrase, catalytic region, zinc finger, CCHC-type, peptidase aspartic, catalytic [Tanacetum cinerariifolium]
MLDEEELAFLADLEAIESQDTQTTMTHNAAFQTDDLDAFDLDYDEAAGAKAVLMANLSNYNSDIIYELDLEPLSYRLKNNREAHKDYLQKTKEHTDTLRRIVKQTRKQHPSDPYLDYAYKCVKSKPGKSKKMEWKSTGKVFTSVGHRWLPTGTTFVINGTKCPMTRITSNPRVPPKETSQTPIITPNLEILVYHRRTNIAKSISFTDEPSILGPRPSNILEPNRNWGSSVLNSPSSSRVHCRSSKSSSGYDDYQIRNVTISKVYYVEGRGHNLFLVGQFCAFDNAVAFRKHTCFVRNLDGDDLLIGSRDTNLYTLSLDDMIRKSKKNTYKSKSKDSIQEKLYLLHMDLYRPMRTKSINEKSSGPALHEMNSGTISLGVVQNPPPSTPYVPPIKNDLNLLFQSMFYEYFNPPPMLGLKAFMNNLMMLVYKLLLLL